jgi:hypothetical protein
MRTTLTLFFSGMVLVTVVGLALSEDRPASQNQPKLTAPRKAQTAVPRASPKANTNLLVIGYLEGRDHSITIKAGPKGPVYSVRTADGKVLCENLSQQQLSASLPEVGGLIKTGIAGTPGAWIDASLGMRGDESGWGPGRR